MGRRSAMFVGMRRENNFTVVWVCGKEVAAGRSIFPPPSPRRRPVPRSRVRRPSRVPTASACARTVAAIRCRQPLVTTLI